MTSPPPHRSVPRGRRPSVESTTARRCPSARRRPGAGFLPAWRPVARVRPIPRERFRVYAEDEFFAQPEHAARFARLDQAAPLYAPRRNAPERSSSPELPVRARSSQGAGGVRVAVGTALLAGVSALGLALALHMLAATPHARRRALLRSARAGASVSPASEGARTASRLPVRRRFTRRDPAKRSRKPARPATDQTREARKARQVPVALAAAAGDSNQGGVVDKPATLAVVAGSASRGRQGEFGFER